MSAGQNNNLEKSKVKWDWAKFLGQQITTKNGNTNKIEIIKNIGQRWNHKISQKGLKWDYQRITNGAN